MLEGDEVYFVVDSDQVDRAMAAFGHEEREARSLLIFGGGNIGMFLARELEANHDWVRAKIIEQNKERAEAIAGDLEKTIVIHGSVIDQQILEEANVSGTETVVAVTNDDETNILSSLLAKKTWWDLSASTSRSARATSRYQKFCNTCGADGFIRCTRCAKTSAN